MATSTTKKKIMVLSVSEYATLSGTGTLTKDGVTYTYSPSDTIYCTPDNTVSEAELQTALSGKVSTSAIKQTTGTSTTDVMSQDAVTTAISTAIADVSALIGGAS